MTDAATPATATRNTGPAPTGGGAQRTPTASAVVNKAMFRFMPITSEKKSKYIKVMMYGGPGMGKTTLAGSAADIYADGDVLLITAEGGDLVFTDNERIKHPERIDMMKCGNIMQVQKVYEWLQRHQVFRDANDEDKLRRLQNMAFLGETDPTEVPEEYKRVRKYRTVILDSLTDIEDLNMRSVLGITEESGFIVGDDLTPPGYTEFRKNNNTIQQLVRAFRNLDVHLIIICGEKWQKDELQRFHYGPWLTGQLANQIQSFVDIVGRMVVGTDPNDPSKEMHKLYVQPVATPKFDAKCRIASFKKPCFNDPLFVDILKECGYNPPTPVD